MSQNLGSQPKLMDNDVRILDLVVYDQYLLVDYKLRRIEFFLMKSIVYLRFSKNHVVKSTVSRK